jgi:capsular polysaccharide biosynthesis protein
VNEGPHRNVSYDLDHYLRPLRRHWPIVLLGVVIGAALGVGAGAVIHPTYVSTASVLVMPTGAQRTTDSAGRMQVAINLETEAQIVRSHPVLRRARRLLELTEPLNELRDRVAVSAPANTTVLDISFSAPSATAAQAGARAISRAYLENRQAVAVYYARDQRNIVNGQIASLRGQLRRQAAIVAARRGGPAARAAAEASVDSYATKLAALETSRSTATATPGGGRVIADAPVPDGPRSPIGVLALMSGIMGGLLVGVVAAVIRDRTDSRLRDTRTLDELGLPVIRWPTHRRVVLRPSTRRAGGLTAPQRLCDLVLATGAMGQGTILVAGLSEHQADAGVARELATAFARLGRTSVLLRVGGQGAPGSEPASSSDPDGRGTLRPHDVRPTAERHLFVADLIHPTASGRFDVTTLRKRLDSLAQKADLVVIAAPPFGSEAMSQTLAGLCDGVILVVQIRVAHTEDVVDALRHVDVVGGTVLGAVVLPLRSGAKERRRGPTPAPAERETDDDAAKTEAARTSARARSESA